MNPPNGTPEKEDIHVPRDADLDDPTISENIPPDGQLTRDEDYARDQQSLPADSEIAKALQDHPPKGDGQLTTGSGGDAARPGKEGIFGKPIPPRGSL